MEKLRAKNLDYIIANDISRQDSGFEVDTNKVLIINNQGEMKDLPLMSKHELAEYIFDNMLGNLENRKMVNRYNEQ